MPQTPAAQFTASDIDIFILTYNRSALLRETIQSIVDQTIKCENVIILDNASTDDTKDVVQTFGFYGVKYIGTDQNRGWEVNVRRAPQLAKAKYSMLLHDDDIIHPQFIDRVLRALNHFDDVVFVNSRFTFFDDKSNPLKDNDKKGDLNERYYLLKKDDESFAASLFWPGTQSNYSGLVCRTDLLKRTNFETLFLDYGKNMDWPFMTTLASMGNIVIMADEKALFYRIHEGQVTFNDDTGVSLVQMMNFAKFFYQKLANGRWRDFYNKQIVLYLKYNYDKFAANSQRREYPFAQIIRKLRKAGALTRMAVHYANRRENFWDRICALPLKFKKTKKEFDCSPWAVDLDDRSV